MDDPVLRVLVVVLVAGAALSGAALSRRGVAMRRRRARLEGAPPGLLVLTSATCPSCERVVRIVGETGHRFRVIGYEEEPDFFRRNRIARVPAIALVDRSGTGWIAEGIPSPRILRRWLAGGGGEAAGEGGP